MFLSPDACLLSASAILNIEEFGLPFTRFELKIPLRSKSILLIPKPALLSKSILLIPRPVVSPPNDSNSLRYFVVF